MTSTIGTRSVLSLQFLAPTPNGSTAWVTHLQADTEPEAWIWLERLRTEYPTKPWRWIWTAEDNAYPHA